MKWTTRAIFIVAALTAAFGQSSPKFEVASIKPSQPGRPFDVIQIMPGGTFRGTHLTIHTLIRMAYDVASYQIRGGPGWIDSDTYDIAAKPDRNATRDQVRLMVQSLLTDRFKLSFHRENKEVAGYAIVIAKKGSKLHASDPATRSRKQIGRSFVDGQAITIASLATSLTQILRCPVSDQTGLTENFDFKLEWTPDRPPEAASTAAEPPLSVFAAIEEQLGLKLESHKTPSEILVIDQLEKPSEN